MAHHIGKLPGIQTMGIDATVRAKGNGHAHLYPATKHLALHIGGFPVFAQIFSRPAFVGADFINIIAVKHIHDQPDALRLGQRQTLFINQAGMFDGADPRSYGGLYAFGPMGMGGRIAAMGLGDGDSGAHLIFG